MSKRQITAAKLETFLDLLRSHPDLTINQLRLFPHELLSAVRVGDLPTGAGMRDRFRLARARQASGPDFDAIVLEVVREARHAIGAKYLRERVGGPRWKLQSAMGRLEAAGLVRRTGERSTTLYRALELEHLALAAE